MSTIRCERIGWYREALRRNGRSLEGHKICCVCHAHFPNGDDGDRLRVLPHVRNL